MKNAVLAFLLVFSPLSLLYSQSANPTNPPAPNGGSEIDSNPAFWQAKFDNGGHYLVKLNSISSISRHEYIANGSARVIEVSIASPGALVARFYYLEPVGLNSNIGTVANTINKVQGLAQSTGSKITPDAGKLQVVKDYPNTTHAHTVEYTLQSEAALSSLYQSLTRAIETSRGRTWQENNQ